VQGHVQLGLVGRKGDSPHLDYRHLGCDRLALIVPGGHAWAIRRSITLEELATVPLILREPGSGSRWCLEQALASAGKSLGDLSIALELGSNEAIKEAVLRGLGLTVLSTHAVQKEIQSDTFRALEVSGLPLEREMYAVWDRRRALTIPAHLFLNLLEPCREPGDR
jgi:DNA-binding transcriptional LysR family regulator